MNSPFSVFMLSLNQLEDTIENYTQAIAGDK